MKIVLLAGGRGTRFWPMSTDARPKQFLKLVSSDETMLQMAYRRYRRYLKPEDVYILTCADYAASVREQLPELDPERLIVEPEPRDTGPGIALMARRFLERQADEVLATVPSDQYVSGDDDLMLALGKAEEAARRDGVVVTLGVAPTRPETGYGYLQAEAAADGLLPVVSFLEKPDADRAERLYRQPNVYWNSGIFIWKPSTIRMHMLRHRPDIWRAVSVPENRLRDAYAKIGNISVDYAIVDKIERLYTIPVSFGWDDIGSWTSLERVFPADGQGNVIAGDVYAAGNRDCILRSDTRNLVVIGADNLIVIATDEGVLVCHKSAEQQIKHAVRRLYDPPEA